MPTDALHRTLNSTTNLSRPNPVLAVFSWAYREQLTRKSTWLTAALLLALSSLVMWVRKDGMIATYFTPDPVPLTVFSGSTWGVSMALSRVLLLFFGFIVAFIATDMVASDLKRGTDQLLMATSVPTWAYVLGRYLAGLLLCLALALLMLILPVAFGYAMYLTGGYPQPDVVSITALWALMAVPATILVCSLSFALGTLLPRYSNFAKVAVVLAWFVCWYSAVYATPNTNAAPLWDVPGRVMGGGLDDQYKQRLQTVGSAQAEAGTTGNPGTGGTAADEAWKLKVRALQQGIVEVQQQRPDFSPWLPSRLTMAGAGLALGIFSAATFRRFKKN